VALQAYLVRPPRSWLVLLPLHKPATSPRTLAATPIANSLQQGGNQALGVAQLHRLPGNVPLPAAGRIPAATRKLATIELTRTSLRRKRPAVQSSVVVLIDNCDRVESLSALPRRPPGVLP
jgi:hypothetical protein